MAVDPANHESVQIDTTLESPVDDTLRHRLSSDEEATPVAHRDDDSPRAKFPTRQLTVLALCRFSEPVAMTSVFPYLFFMINDFGIAKDEKQIGQYVGFLASSFAFAQFLTGMAWGSFSDRVGRKPVILMGLVGTIISGTAFGFSTSYSNAIIARSMGGFLNGNVGVIRTMVAELITEKSHQSRAFSIMPFVWSLGSIIGPSIGGALASPATQYPDWFGGNAFFLKFPYAAPNLVAGVILAICTIFGFFFLEETLESKRYKPDTGIRIRMAVLRWLRAPFQKRPRRRRVPTHQSSISSEMSVLSQGEEDALQEQPFLRNRLTERRPSVYTRYRRSSSFIRPNIPKKSRLRDVFRNQVIINMCIYACLALHTISFDQLFPLFCSTAPNEGGLGMSANQVGLALSFGGFMAMILQISVFPVVCERYGPVICLRAVSLIYPFMYFAMPYVSILSLSGYDSSSWQLWVALIGVQLLKVVAGVFAFPSAAILITNSAPAKSFLGTINGANQAFASLARALGPFIGKTCRQFSV